MRAQLRPWQYRLMAKFLHVEVRMVNVLLAFGLRLIIFEGLDRVRLWLIDKGVELRTPENGTLLRGSPSCMTWARLRDDDRNILCFGTLCGYLVLWAQGEMVSTLLYVPARLTNLPRTGRQNSALCGLVQVQSCSA
jgi:hypothetical protein